MPDPTPAGADLRDRIASEILRAGDGESVFPNRAADAALDVVGPELERLRGQVATWRKATDDTGLALAEINRERGEAQDRANAAEAEVERLRAELAERTDERDKARALAGVRGDLLDEARQRLECAQRAGRELQDALEQEIIARKQAEAERDALGAAVERARGLLDGAIASSFGGTPEGDAVRAARAALDAPGKPESVPERPAAPDTADGTREPHEAPESRSGSWLDQLADAGLAIWQAKHETPEGE